MEYFDDEPSNSYYGSDKPSGSGLTLRLPALKSSKTGKSGKKWKSSSFADYPSKAPKPVKLKPLREVLTRLVEQIKKKDDYAFFLKPVDPRLVPGYAEVVQRPMDLGTMTTKVAKGKYRSLEDFASDFRLVVSNAKLFNPPGTIYHSEAERIEAWGLDRITKAAATVIEYETDWNIEIEGDDDRSVAIDEDNELETPGPPDENRRSPSIVSNQPQGGRRGTRTVTTTKKGAVNIPESLETDGGLPGAKDGLGAFPPGSDWARVILALKIKGKKYRTKKERLRVEKSGPPLAADGSLDYWEMEDPFTKLEALVPGHLFQPPVTPLFPFPSESAETSTAIPSPGAVSLKRKFPDVSPDLTAPSPKRRHWSISRNPTRARGHLNDEEPMIPAWKTPRAFHADDFAPFSELMGDLVEDCGVQGVEDQTKLYEVLRSSLVNQSEGSDQSSIKAQEYIQEVVYGGVDGLAYLRSVAEFISGAPGTKISELVQESIVNYITQGRHRILQDTLDYMRDSSKPSLEERLRILTEKIDLSCLIRTPNELLQVETEWSGVAFKEDRRRKREIKKEEDMTTSNGAIIDPMEYLTFALETHAQADSEAATLDADDPEVFGHVLDGTAKALRELLTGSGSGRQGSSAAEDTVTKQLRMDLLALAKRVPVDQVAFSALG